MKNIFIIGSIFCVLISCQSLSEEDKLAQQIEKSVLKICDCTSVEVTTENNTKFGSKLIVEINSNRVDDLSAKAETIIENLEQEIPEIALNNEILVRFVEGDAFEEFSFEGHGTAVNEQTDNVVNLSKVQD